MLIIYFILTIFLTFFSLGSKVKGTDLEFREHPFLKESLRARGMGYAQTAVANDEYLLFYNPAGLRSLQDNIYEIFGFYFANNTELSSGIPFIGGHGSTNSTNVNATEGGIGAITGKNKLEGWYT